MSEAKIEQMVKDLSELSVLDLSKLKSALEDAWGVEAAAAAPMMMAAAPAAAGADAAAEESTEFDVILDSFDASKKIGIIKIVREVTGLGLKEAKELVEGAPKTLKEAAGKSDAEEIVKKLTEAGAKATMKGV